MKMGQRSVGNLRLIAIVALIGVFVFSVANPGTKQFSSTGYENAFQNPQITFYGESYNGHNYLANSPTNLVFDKNIVSQLAIGLVNTGLLYLPTVQGELTPVFIPSQSTTYMNVLGVSIPSTWTQNLDMYYAPGWQNNPTAELQNPPQPVETYNWNVTDPTTGTPYMTQMQQWDQKFYCSFSTSWTSSQDPSDWIPAGSSTGYNQYSNLWVWFKIETPVTWYIQGGGTAYQAIAQINLDDNAQMQAKDNKGNNVQTDNSEVVNPESASSIVYLYYSPFGQSNSVTNPTPENYEGSMLNPEYFRNTTYFGIDLAAFGNYATWNNILDIGTTTRGDVATFDFDVTTFVFGQYTVLDIMNNPTQYGRTTPETTVTNFLSGIIGWLSNPINIGILTTIGILILIIIFAPWLLVVLIALVFGGRRR